MNLKPLLLAPLLLYLSVAQGDRLYKWVDAQGNVTYHDRPPDNAGYQVEEKEINAPPAASDAAAEAAKKFPVVIYSAKKCGSCDSARAYLEKRNVPFKEHNVENDRDLQKKLIAKTGSLSVPTILVGEKVMKGYLESLLEGELDQAGYPKTESPPTSAEPEEAKQEEIK
jgi:glutaredoxin